MTETSDWQRTSVFAVLFFLVRLIKSLAQNALQAFAPVAAFLFAYDAGMPSKIALAAIVLPACVLLVAFLRYWFFRYRITDEAILIRQGIVHKKQLDIRFERIQGINTEQSFFYRPLGLVTVSFDTAGSAGSEGSLPAVDLVLAERLRGKIAANVADPRAPLAPTPQREPILRLNIGDIVRIGLSDRRAFIVLAVLAPLYEQLGHQGRRLVEKYVAGALSALGDLGIAAGVSAVIAALLLVIVLLACASVIVALLRYHDFRLDVSDGRIETVGGLLTRHSSSMDTSKIQLVHCHQGVLLRLFDRWRVVFRQATSAGTQQQSKSIALPMVEPATLPALSDIAFAPELTGLDLDPGSARFRAISARYLRPRVFVYGLLPVVVLIWMNWEEWGARSALAGLWLPLVALYFFQIWRRYGVQVAPNGLVLRSGLIGYRLDVILSRKVQRITVTQSWWQRRSGLAGMSIYLASGSVRLRYIDHDFACDLRDRMLFMAQSSQRSWY